MMNSNLHPVRTVGGWICHGLAVSLLVACAAQPASEPDRPQPEPWFEEVATSSGLNFQHVRATEVRYWLPEIMSGGACWIDFDGDGDLDLYLVQGGDLVSTNKDSPRNRLFRNDGKGHFEDAAIPAVEDPGYGMGCAVADVDGDGDDDLYVTNVGPNRLFRNDEGTDFTDVTEEAGVGEPGWGTSAVFFDYDVDGALDLFVTNYVDWSPDREIECHSGGNERDYCVPQNYQSPAGDHLFRNLGNGRFEETTRRAGISGARGNGLGVVAADFNEDSWIDLYVANDGDPNQLWLNGGDGTFSDQALILGCALNRHGQAEASMGVAPVDADQDGDLDIFMSHLRDETNTIFLNEGGFFRDITPSSGLSAASVGMTGFGLGFADFDHDGFEDLYIGNGRVGRTLAPDSGDPFAEPNLLFQGLGQARFQVVPGAGTVELLAANSRAVALADYDNDGDIDVLIANNGGTPHLLRNLQGSRGHWLKVRLFRSNGQEAVGARVRVTFSEGILWRTSGRGYSYLAGNDPHLHFGLGKSRRVEEVKVYWPGGSAEVFGPFEADRTELIRERGQ